MNTLKSYIKEGLFSSDSIEDQIGDQYYVSLFNSNKFRNYILKVFSLRLRYTIDDLIKYDKETETLRIYLEYAYTVKISNYFFLLKKYFDEFKNVILIKSSMNLIVEFRIKIDNNKAKLFNEFFKNISFNSIKFFKDADDLIINYGITDIMSSFSSIYLITDSLKNIKINITEIKPDINKIIEIYVSNINNLKELEFISNSSTIKNIFNNTKKHIIIPSENIYNDISEYIKNYYDPDKKTITYIKQYNHIKELVYSIINNTKFYNENVFIEITKSRRPEIQIVNKKDEIILKYKTHIYSQIIKLRF